MTAQFLSPSARQVEARLGSDNRSILAAFTKQLAIQKVESQGFAPSDYVFTAERRNDLAGRAAFGPRRIDLGTYSDQELYGASGSPVPRFRLAIRALADKATNITKLDPDEVEYAHQTTLFWSEIGSLKDFIPVSPIVGEIVAELRTARFQMLGQDTPPEFIQAVASGLKLVAGAHRLDADLVDAMVEVMERGGFDSLAPAALSESHE